MHASTSGRRSGGTATLTWFQRCMQATGRSTYSRHDLPGARPATHANERRSRGALGGQRSLAERDVEQLVVLPSRRVEVPPLGGERLESLGDHGDLEARGVRACRRRGGRAAVCALREVVEVGGHLERDACDIDERQVDGGAAVVLRARDW